MRSSRARVAGTALAVPGLVWSALLTVGGVRAAADPLMRPPRLPDRRPPAWFLPVLGTVTGAAVTAAGTVLRRGGVRGRALPGPVRAVAAAGLVAAGTPGVLAPVFDAVRRTTTGAPAVVPGTIVILGCALRGGAPSILLEARLRRAAALAAWAAGPGARDAPDIIVTGGRGEDEDMTEATVMTAWLRGAGSVPAPCRIVGEHRATNTAENLDYTAPLVAARPVVVVTSDFHVPRVRAEIRRRGLRWSVTGAPTPFRFWATSMLREYLATLVRRPGVVAGTAAGLSALAVAAVRG